MKVKKVYKYGTGDVIPEGAIYLCTQTETKTFGQTGMGSVTTNVFVWHYFLVEVEEEK